MTSALAMGDVKPFRAVVGRQLLDQHRHPRVHPRGAVGWGGREQPRGLSAHPAQEMQSSPCRRSALSLARAIGRSFKAEPGKGRADATNPCTVPWPHHLRHVSSQQLQLAG